MKTPGIILRRYPYEEPYHLNLVLTACNGVFGGRLEYYCNADDLATLGTVLTRFPRQTTDDTCTNLAPPKRTVNSRSIFGFPSSQPIRLGTADCQSS